MKIAMRASEAHVRGGANGRGVRTRSHNWFKLEGMYGFGSARIKLARAAELHQSLSALTDPFEADQVSSVALDRDPESGKFIAIFDAPVPDVPQEWSCLVGDIMHNLRSALDHLIFGLDPKAGSHTGFPICTTPEKFAKSLTGPLGSVPAEVQAAVRAEQPFNHKGEHDPLYLLDELNKQDKHRHLPLTLSSLIGAKGDSAGLPDDYYVGPLKQGVALASFTRPIAVRRDWEPIIRVVFTGSPAGGRPVSAVTHAARKRAGGIVAKFTVFDSS